MAEEEAKLMGLTLMDDPETLANPPRDIRAKYLYDPNSVEDWGSSVSEDDDDEDDTELEQFNLETGGLTDREIDQLDNKTSSRLGQSKKTSSSPTSPSGVNTAKYPERESGANTGPKGVLADQKYHHQQQLQERLSSRQAYNARMLAKAPTTTTYREDQMRMLQEKKAQGLLDSDDEAKLKAELGDEDALDKLLNNDEDEKTVLERIRGNRLKDMSASWASKPGDGGGGGGLMGKKMFGSLMEMNAAQYVSAIDGEKKDVTVVIHIYSEFNPACKRLDDCLILLAARYATTKFIRIKAREVDFDEEVCPTVLVYRAGDLIANLVMITFELSQEYDDKELEELLTKHKVLSPHDQCQRETSFFDRNFSMDSLSALGPQFGSMSMGGSLGGGGTRRGILSGNVPEFRYKDYEDDDNAEY
ncbi:hypothetical protein BGZ59_002939 [Podila verticillata]|nr:hypothetical protein BGZ59_002939 [Podila verticillata]KFH67338.1 hypothetical protein MVEG_06072 [Podila verticillata NRRL 6337]